MWQSVRCLRLQLKKTRTKLSALKASNGCARQSEISRLSPSAESRRQIFGKFSRQARILWRLSKRFFFHQKKSKKTCKLFNLFGIGVKNYFVVLNFTCILVA